MHFYIIYTCTSRGTGANKTITGASPIMYRFNLSLQMLISNKIDFILVVQVPRNLDWRLYCALKNKQP